MPADTSLDMYVRAGNNSDISDGSWVAVNNNDSLAQFNNKKYIQYKAELITNDTNVTPILKDVAIGINSSGNYKKLEDVTIPCEIENHSRFAEIRVKFEGDGNSSPVLKSLSLDYEGEEEDRDCRDCHKTKYPADEFEKQLDKNDIDTSVCMPCHYGGRHGKGAQGFYSSTPSELIAPWGVFQSRDDTAFDDKTIINKIHNKHIKKSGGNCSYTSDAVRCHSTSVACDTCHKNVAHGEHGKTKYESSTETRDYVYSGAPFVRRKVQCTNSKCHGQFADFNLVPECQDCHDSTNNTEGEEGHGDIEGIQDCKVCHGPDAAKLNKQGATDHENWWGFHPKKQGDDKNCWTCHDNERLDSEEELRVQRAIYDRNSRCNACHDDVPHTNPPHKFEVTLDESCVECHGDTIEDIHMNQYSDDYLRTLSCYDTSEDGKGCHQYDLWKTFNINKEDPSDCTNCNESDSHPGHKTTVLEECKNCHIEKDEQGEYLEPDLLPIHSDKNLSCKHCHNYEQVVPENERKLDPERVSTAIAEGNKECSACHDEHGKATDKHEFNSIPDDCTRCHTKDQTSKNLQPIHEYQHNFVTNKTNNCGVCHDYNKWKSWSLSNPKASCYNCHSDNPDFTAGNRHSGTTSKHADNTMPTECKNSECHSSNNAINVHTDVGYDCYSCHRSQSDGVKKQIRDEQMQCQTGYCHSTTHPAENHTASLNNDCAVCHNRDVGIEHDENMRVGKCDTCHNKKQNLSALSGPNCNQCHSWPPHDLNGLHDSKVSEKCATECHSKFLQTEHKNRGVGCAQCHKPRTYSSFSGRSKVSSAIDTKVRQGKKDCFDCHDDHPYGGNKCSTCHSSNFEQCMICHEGYEDHKGEVECITCHSNSFDVHHMDAVFEATECAECHKDVGHSKDNKTETCLECHPKVQHLANFSFASMLKRAGIGLWHSKIDKDDLSGPKGQKLSSAIWIPGLLERLLTVQNLTIALAALIIIFLILYFTVGKKKKKA